MEPARRVKLLGLQQIHCLTKCMARRAAQTTGKIFVFAETINGLYKAEVIHRRGPWRSFEAVEFATLEWVDWFNNRRLLEPIGNIPPAEAEAAYYAMLAEQPLAA